MWLYLTIMANNDHPLGDHRIVIPVNSGVLPKQSHGMM